MGVIELDRRTHERLRFVANLRGVDEGQAVAMLLDMAEKASLPDDTDDADPIRIHAVYKGTRVEGTFDPETSAVTIVGGPLAGTRFDKPSQAAKAVVASIDPMVNPHRNGWKFWIVTKTGKELESIRRG